MSLPNITPCRALVGYLAGLDRNGSAVSEPGPPYLQLNLVLLFPHRAAGRRVVELPFIKDETAFPKGHHSWEKSREKEVWEPGYQLIGRVLA